MHLRAVQWKQTTKPQSQRGQTGFQQPHQGISQRKLMKDDPVVVGSHFISIPLLLPTENVTHQISYFASFVLSVRILPCSCPGLLPSSPGATCVDGWSFVITLVLSFFLRQNSITSSKLKPSSIRYRPQKLTNKSSSPWRMPLTRRRTWAFESESNIRSMTNAPNWNLVNWWIR